MVEVERHAFLILVQVVGNEVVQRVFREVAVVVGEPPGGADLDRRRDLETTLDAVQVKRELLGIEERLEGGFGLLVGLALDEAGEFFTNGELDQRERSDE